MDIIEVDSAGAYGALHTVESLNPTVLSSTNIASTLPADWLDATGPWYITAMSITDWLFELQDMTVMYLEFAPAATATTIEVIVITPLTISGTVIIGAIESLSTREAVRAQNSLSIQQSTIEAITTYLDGGTPVPLLEPDTLYTITVDYDANDYEPGSSSPTTTSMQQAFQFKTSATPPTTLEPYVLCSSPTNGNAYVFYGDPLQIIFNDSSVFTLIEAYGQQLIADLHAADGLTESSPSSTAVIGSPPPLAGINGIGPATYDAMLALAKELSCLGGSISAYQNQCYTAPVALRPLMGYTLTSSPASTPTSPVRPTRPSRHSSAAHSRPEGTKT